MIVGMMAGIGAIVLRYLIKFIGASTGFSTDPYSFTQSSWGLAVVIAPALGGLVAGLLIWRFASEAKGHGVPEVMTAMLTNKGRIRPRVGIIKTLASAITIGSGGSAGREGPMVQIGATSGSSLGQFLNLSTNDTRTLLACGAAAGIAATFNAPLGAIMFAIELILLEFRTKSFIPLVISSVVATIISHAAMGEEIAFPIKNLYALSDPVIEMPLYIILGIVCALAALLFIWMLYKFEDFFDDMKIPEYIKPMLGGLALGVMGLISFNFMGQYYIFNTGYGTMMPILDPGGWGPMGIVGVDLLILFIILALLKIIATSFTLGSGGSGGVFAPSLFIGAAVGGAFGVGVNMAFPTIETPYSAYALVGMAAVFVGTSRATLTAIFIMFEMTSNYQIILPLMFACVVSDAVANILSKETIYTKKLIKKGIRYSYDREVNILETILVDDVMVPRERVRCARDDMTVRQLTEVVIETGYQGFPCVDDNDVLTGIVTHSDLRGAILKGQADSKICDVKARHSIAVVHPDNTLEEAMELLAEKSYGHLPVTSREVPGKLVGFLTRNSILEVHRDKKKEREHTWL